MAGTMSEVMILLLFLIWGILHLSDTDTVRTKQQTDWDMNSLYQSIIMGTFILDAFGNKYVTGYSLYLFVLASSI